MILAGYSPWGHNELDTTKRLTLLKLLKTALAKQMMAKCLEKRVSFSN